MGFFKNIGKSIKKNVSLKNVLKVATPLMGAIPFVGGYVQSTVQGLQDAHAAKKSEKEAQNEYERQLAQQQQQMAKNQVNQNLSQMAYIASASTGKVFGDAVMQGVNDGLSSGFVSGSGEVGATVVTSTLKVWFQRNWKIVAGSVAGLIALIWFIRRDSGNSTRVPKRR
jgi:hypothetical protein